MISRVVRTVTAAAVCSVIFVGAAWAQPSAWSYEWPDTDFTKTSVDFGDILSGGPPKDGIPAIDKPRHIALSAVDQYDDFQIEPTEPVVGVTLNGEMRAYLLSVLMWHEIVNDEVGGIPVSVTFCPLCNAAVVFDRRLDGRVLDFGTTGKLRNSDLVMYDRQTESWWQQFLGEAIIGELLGERLTVIPARLESWANFKARANDAATLLVPTNAALRRYGANPYRGYDTSSTPFLYRGEALQSLKRVGVAPLARVITVDRLGDGVKEAWSLDLLRERKRVETDDGFVITWEPGQNSALDSSSIAKGLDVGNVLVQRRTEQGALADYPYGIDFAFAYKAFFPDGQIIVD
ncbi:MAG: DUF3179 domain-containing protein [Proteobacteria bacterium]|nr:DUF3179 domain-containing protein [Pseudomonadota bacterium]MDA1059038.1 DUF3179 domain-containing protein [Pseudomonadota bacterium]